MSAETADALFDSSLDTLPDAIRELTRLRDATGKSGPRATLTACVAVLSRYVADETEHLRRLDETMTRAAEQWTALREVVGLEPGATTNETLSAAVAAITTLLATLAEYMAEEQSPSQPSEPSTGHAPPAP